MSLRVSPALFESVRAAVEKAYPEEGCGVLIGVPPEKFDEPQREVAVLEVRALANGWDASAKTNRYAVDPKELLKLERELAGTGRGIIGFYHSHPDVPAWPSPFDLERSWPCYSYWILCVRKGKSDGSRSWVRSEDGNSFSEEKVVIGE